MLVFVASKGLGRYLAEQRREGINRKAIHGVGNSIWSYHVSSKNAPINDSVDPVEIDEPMRRGKLTG